MAFAPEQPATWRFYENLRAEIARQIEGNPDKAKGLPDPMLVSDIHYSMPNTHPFEIEIAAGRVDSIDLRRLNYADGMSTGRHARHQRIVAIFNAKFNGELVRHSSNLNEVSNQFFLSCGGEMLPYIVSETDFFARILTRATELTDQQCTRFLEIVVAAEPDIYPNTGIFAKNED